MLRIHARDRAIAALVLAAMLFSASPVSGQSAAPLTWAEGQDNAVILAVTVNGLPGDEDEVFQESRTGGLLARESFLNTWNFNRGEAPLTTVDGSRYVDLGAIRGLSYQWDHESSELSISAAPEAFVSSRLNIGAGAADRVAPYAPGASLNYDLSVTHGAGISSTEALVDVALFRGIGLLTSSMVAGTAGNARLMTTWQTDRIDKLKTLRLGDSYNSTGAWGRGLLFGGIQYGTNFAVRPDYVTVAMPSVTGKALLPSTVDIYVNHALRSRQVVNAGAFSIQNLPLITGNGELQVVVKDVLGREQLITQPFFASPSLLRAGLVDDSFEFGWLRENYGLTSNDYNDPFAAVTYRRGLTNTLTGEGRVEMQRDLAAAGVSVAAKVPGLGSIVESSLVGSSATGLSPGAMGSASISYAGQRWSANARVQQNSVSFRQVGSDPASLPRQIAAAQVSTPLWDGTLSMNYLRHQNYGETAARIFSLNYSRRIAEGMFVSFTWIKPLMEAGGTIASLGLTVVFDPKHVGSSTLNLQSGAASLYSDFQQATPRDVGTGYRVAMMNGAGSQRQEASLTHNQSFGTYQADVVRMNDEYSTRLSTQGGIATLGGGVYFSRGLSEGFAVVEAKDIAGIPVYLENQQVGRTDKNGRAIVTNLHAYQENRIAIDPVSLPMDVAMGDVVQEVVPRSRGGILVDFAVRRVHSATLSIVQADGTLLPAWTPVEVAGVETPYISGNRGEVFVDLPLVKANRVVARPEGGPVCTLSVDQPDAGQDSPFLGPLQCAVGE